MMLGSDERWENKEQLLWWSIHTLAIIVAYSILFLLLGSHLATAESGKIAFSKLIDNKWQIVVTDENGKNLINLTNNNSDNSSPVWSPDGKYIAFISGRDGNSEIYIMDADGSNQHRITNNPHGLLMVKK
jgi:WD40 repeat protein